MLAPLFVSYTLLRCFELLVGQFVSGLSAKMKQYAGKANIIK